MLTGYKLGKILVLTDFSSLSTAGVVAALSIARGSSYSSITLMHVVEPPPAAELVEFGLMGLGAIDQLVGLAEQELAKLRLCFGEGVNMETHVAVGSVAQMICDFAEQGGFDLIVMSSHGRSGLKRVFLGSIAEAVANRAPCSVLVTKLPKDPDGEWMPHGATTSWRNIIVGYDHRPGSVRAMGMAGEISERTNGRLILVNALPAGDHRHPDHQTETDLDNHSVLRALERLERTRLAYSPLSAEWETAARPGPPWEVLSEEARKRESDLVVVGPHEHTKRMMDFIGSTPQRLIRYCPCSVLVVK